MATTKVQSEHIAINAISGTIIADNAITSVHIAQNAILTQHIDDGQVGTAQLAADAVTGAKLADSSIVTANIQDDQVTGDKLANNITIAGTLTSTGAITGTLATAAQTNITSLGTLTGLTIEAATARSYITSTGAGNSAALVLQADSADTTAENGGVYYVADNTADSSYLALSGDNANYHLSVTHGGNVGIGTSSPSYLLDISGDSRVRVTGTNASNFGAYEAENNAGVGAFFGMGGNGRSDILDNRAYALGQSSSDGLVLSCEGSDPIIFAVGGIATSNEVMRIDSSGKVGIGTTSPNAAEFSATPNGVLEVEGTKPVVYLSETDTTDAHGWLGVSSGVTYLGSTGGGLQIRTGTDSASTKVTVDTSGKVGIGTTSPSTTLHTKGGSGSAFIRIDNSADGHDTGFEIYQNGSRKWELHSDDSQSDCLSIRNASGAEKFRFLQAGGLTFNGDSAAANALDDYEEGTWSPTLIGTTGSAGSYANGGTPNANYTKVGRLVTIQCSFYITNKGSYTGKTIVAGLPFTNATSTSAVITHSFPDAGYGTTSGNVLIGGAVGASDNRVHFYDGARLDARHDYADVGTGYYVNLSGSYMAAT